MYVDTYGRARDHYRAIANELRLVVLRMKHPEAAEELRLLASKYERLAEWHAAAPRPCLETTGIAPPKDVLLVASQEHLAQAVLFRACGCALSSRSV